MPPASRTARRGLSDAVVFHLPFHNHVHEFDAAKQDAGATKILEPEHGSGAPLDRAVVLFDEPILAPAVLPSILACEWAGLRLARAGRHEHIRAQLVQQVTPRFPL